MSTPRGDPSAEELAQAAQTGTVAAFEALVERFQAPLFRFLRLRTRDASDAEEVAQTTLVRAWSSIQRYDARRPFATWLFTIARHAAVSHHRHLVRRGSSQLLPADLASDAPSPADAMTSDEERDNLWALAARVLSPDQRSAVWLRYVEDMPPTDIGRVLGKRSATVRVLLFRARRILARHLPRPAGECTTAAEAPPPAPLAAAPLARSGLVP